MQSRLDDIKVEVPEGTLALEGQTEDVEVPHGPTDSMKLFFRNVESIKETMQYIGEKTNDVHRLQDEALNAFRAEDSAKVNEELEHVLTDANARLTEAKQLLSKMKMENDEMEKKGADSELRIRKNMYQTLTQNFVSTVRNFQKAQQTYKTKMKSKVARQVQIVKPDATMEEIDQVMTSGDPGAIYRAAILQPGSDPIAQAYVDAQAKYKDVLILEQSVRALHQMFLDMALLVERQGELLDQIQLNVEAASEHVTKGNVELQKAHHHRKAIRKKYMIIAVICIIIIIVIILVVLK